MNRKLFLAVADAIERNPESFDQTWYGQPEGNRAIIHRAKCRSPCCCAGHAVRIAGANAIDVSKYDADAIQAMHGHAAEKMRLDDDDAHLLFAAHWPAAWYRAAGIDDFPAAGCGWTNGGEDPEVVTNRARDRRPGKVGATTHAEPAAAQAARILRLMAARGTVRLEETTS